MPSHLQVTDVDGAGVVPCGHAGVRMAEPAGSDQNAMRVRDPRQLRCPKVVRSHIPYAGCLHGYPEPTAESVVALLPVNGVALPPREQERVRIVGYPGKVLTQNSDHERRDR